MAKNKDLVAQTLAFLASAGVDTSTIPKQDTRNYRNGDAQAVFARLPAHFRPSICINCKRPFGTNRKSVGYCGDPCRHEDWKKTTGITWNSVSTHDVWDGDPPMIITPDQFQALKRVADWFTQNQKLLETTLEPNLEPEFLEPEMEEETGLESDPFPDDFHTSPHVLPVQPVQEQNRLEDYPFDF